MVVYAYHSQVSTKENIFVSLLLIICILTGVYILYIIYKLYENNVFPVFMNIIYYHIIIRISMKSSL